MTSAFLRALHRASLPQPSWTWCVWPAVAACLWLSGCARPVALTPVADMEGARVSGDTVAVEQGGVSLLVESETWPGPPVVATEVTPLRVAIDNDSGHPIRIRYKDFALVAADGTRYAALPPYRAQRRTAKATAVLPVAPVGFYYRGFLVAPYLGYYFAPYVLPYDGDFAYDDPYYTEYYPFWGALQAEAMNAIRANAIPPGVIEDGGRVGGFLYFKKVPVDARRVVFKADLADVKSGAEVARFSVPFMVQKGD